MLARGGVPPKHGQIRRGQGAILVEKLQVLSGGKLSLCEQCLGNFASVDRPFDGNSRALRSVQKTDYAFSIRGDGKSLAGLREGEKASLGAPVEWPGMRVGLIEVISHHHAAIAGNSGGILAHAILEGVGEKRQLKACDRMRGYENRQGTSDYPATCSREKGGCRTDHVSSLIPTLK